MIRPILLSLTGSLLLLLLCCVGANPAPGSKTVSSDMVFALTECHLNYEYRDGPPKRVQERGPEQRDSFMQPYFGIERFLAECMQTKPRLVQSEFFALQQHIFDASGFNEWKAQVKQSMAKHYDEIGKNVKYEVRGKSREVTEHLWREMLIPYGFAVQDVYFTFGKILLDKLLDKLRSTENMVEPSEERALQKVLETANWLSARLGQDITNQELIISPHNEFPHNIFFNTVWQKYPYEQYLGIFKTVNMLMSERLTVAWSKSSQAPLAAHQLALPKPKRVIWVVRHSERFDDLGGRKTEGCLIVNGRVFGCDNTPLSDRGRERASELQQIFAKIPVNHIFACPYERNVETAHQLLGQLNAGMKIKPEPGFLRKCTDAKTESCEALQEHHRRLDCDYKPVDIEFDCERERAGIDGNLSSLTDALMPRLADVMDKLFGDHNGRPSPQLKEPYNQSNLVKRLKEGTVQSEWLAPGEEDAEHIVIVTHGTVTVTLEKLFDGKYTFTPMISINKFVQLDHPERQNESIFEQIHLIYESELRHRYHKTKATAEDLKTLFLH